MVVHELYGMSEVTGPQSLQTGPRTVIGSVGPTMPGCETRLANKDADGNGEICLGQWLTRQLSGKKVCPDKNRQMKFLPKVQ